jgi:thiol:disulfide interchange protein DsbC
MNRFWSASLLLLPALALCAASAGANTDAALLSLKTKIQQRFPQVKVTKVLESDIPGWYEVVSSDRVVYSNADGSRLFVGSVYDTATKKDLTARRWADLHPVDFDSLPLNLAVKSVRGDGRRKLVVFADPLCPFCKQLEEQLETVQNVTVYTFVWPLENLHPGATARASRIWCAADRAQAWKSWMLKREEASAEECDLQGLTTIKNLATQLNVNETPTLFFADGHRVPGASSVEELEQEFTLADAKPKRR